MTHESEISTETRSARHTRILKSAFAVVVLAGVLGGLLFLAIRSIPKRTTVSPGLVRITLFSNERGALPGYELNGRRSAPVGNLHESLDFDLAQVVRDHGFRAAPEKEARFRVDERLQFGDWRKALNLAAGHLDGAPRVARVDIDPHPERPTLPTQLTFETVEGTFLIDYPWRHLPAEDRNFGGAGAPAIKVRLRSLDGHLAGVLLGGRNLGNDEHAFVRLNGEILKLIGRPGNPLTRDIGVLLYVPDDLPARYAIDAFKACYGRLDRRTGTWVRYIYRIRFGGVPENEAAGE